MTQGQLVNLWVLLIMICTLYFNIVNFFQPHKELLVHIIDWSIFVIQGACIVTQLFWPHARETQQIGVLMCQCRLYSQIYANSDISNEPNANYFILEALACFGVSLANSHLIMFVIDRYWIKIFGIANLFILLVGIIKCTYGFNQPDKIIEMLQISGPSYFALIFFHILQAKITILNLNQIIEAA